MGRARNRVGASYEIPQVRAGVGIRHDIVQNSAFSNAMQNINEVLGLVIYDDGDSCRPGSDYDYRLRVDDCHVTLTERRRTDKIARRTNALWTPAVAKAIGKQLAGRLQTARDKLGLPPLGRPLNVVCNGVRRFGRADLLGQRRVLTLLPDEEDAVTKYLYIAAREADVLLGKHIPDFTNDERYTPHVSVAYIGDHVEAGRLHQAAR